MKKAALLLAFVVTIYGGAISAAEFVTPFGLATAPDARLVVSDVYDTYSGSSREESTARLGTINTPQKTIAFYRKALEEAGFRIYSSFDRGDSAYVAGKRGNDRITVLVKKESNWVEPGENEIHIIAQYDK